MKGMDPRRWSRWLQITAAVVMLAAAAAVGVFAWLGEQTKGPSASDFAGTSYQETACELLNDGNTERETHGYMLAILQNQPGVSDTGAIADVAIAAAVEQGCG